MSTHDEVVELAAQRSMIGLARENLGLQRELEEARRHLKHWQEQSHRLAREIREQYERFTVDLRQHPARSMINLHVGTATIVGHPWEFTGDEWARADWFSVVEET